MSESMPPQRQVAQDFMEHKGYGELEPTEVEHVEPYCWIYTYELAEGELDLRVEWLLDRSDWDVGVDDFRLY